MTEGSSNTGYLGRLCDPRHIAYIGGVQIAGPIRACKRAGYNGDIWVVNPSKDEIEGVRCVASVSELPSPPDAAVIGLSPERAITVVEQLSQSGAGGAVVMSSGFAELGTEAGRDRQERLKKAAGTMPLLGPNCMGLINQFSGAAVWGDDNHVERQDGPAAAIISQSGALLIGITNVEQAFPLGYAVSLGNQAVTTSAEFIETMLEDRRIRAIGLYVEGLSEGEAFGRACLKALRKGIPVVALKGGDGVEGSKVSLSHTASMVVERDIWEAFCARFGIVEVSSPKALVEALKLLTTSGIPTGNRVSIVSYSGGLNGLAATRAGLTGLNLPMPARENEARLSALMPETVAINNPLDLNIPFRASDGSISMQDTRGVAEALTAFAEGVSDQLVFFIDVPRPGAAGLDKVWCASLEALIQVRRRLNVPVTVAGILPDGLPVDFRRHMYDNGVAALLGFSETMEALSVSARLASAYKAAASNPRPRPLFCSQYPTETAMLNEADSKSCLNAFGLPVPEHAVADLVEAATAAERLGFPVAVKVLSATIAHKAEVGGVALNLKNAGQVNAACSMIANAVALDKGGHTVKKVLIERMVEDVEAEMIIGVKRHPAMGLAMMVGCGGAKAEEISRFETLLLPLAGNALRQALTDLGVSHHAAADALHTACKAVADYAASQYDRLVTLDVNPVMLTCDGRAIAADALIVLGK